MTHRLRLLLLLAATFLLAGHLAAEPPPPAPEGFAWVSCKPMQGTFLKPRGWHVLEEEKGGTLACFITREKIVPPGGFDTGVTINLIKDVPAKTNLRPSDYAARYIQVLEQKYALLKKVGSTRGAFDHLAVEFISQDGGAAPIHMWHILVANNRTGSLHLVVAEAPASLWAEQGPTLETIVSTLGLDDAI